MNCFGNPKLRQLTELSGQLIVDFLTNLLQQISQIKKWQCKPLSLGNIQPSLHYRQAQKYFTAWTPKHLQTKQLLAYTASQSAQSRDAIFDSDSYAVLIDNCCTACITNCVHDFCNLPQKTRSSISGIGGPIGITLQGTLKWALLDDQGRRHTFLIPNAYYVPSAPH